MNCGISPLPTSPNNVSPRRRSKEVVQLEVRLGPEARFIEVNSATHPFR